jgi:hypothetical protein
MATIGVAIPIAEPYGSELQKYRADFGDPMASSIPTHVTLLPPTEVPDEDLPRIDEHLLELAARADPEARTGRAVPELPDPPARHGDVPADLAGGVRHAGRGHLVV